MGSAYRMVSVAEALATVLAQTSPLPAARVPLAAALGLVLAEDVVAAEPQPPFRASVKDGYAVRWAEGAGVFALAPVASRAAAADGPAPALPPGCVAYITTGAPLPEGADAVVQVENTEAVADEAGAPPRVRIRIPARCAGEDVRAVGSDVAAGSVVLAAGERLGAAELGLLASVGAASVLAHPRPRAAVLSTGDELADAATPPGGLRHGEVRDSNRPMLLAALAEAGFPASDWGAAPDTAAGLRARLADALGDASLAALVTSGGVSVGDRDLVKPLLEACGVVHFGRVLMKPGKPLTFATVPRPGAPPGAPPLLVFGLPGNPVSSLVTFHLAVAPALRRLAGWRHPGPRRLTATLAAPLRLDPERPEYHRATLAPGARPGAPPVAHSTGGQLSSRLLSARSAAALLELPAAAGTLPAGTPVAALLVGDLACADGLAGAAPLDVLYAVVPPPSQQQRPAAAAAAAAAVPPPVVVGVLTVSDRASSGVYEDLSGPAIVDVLRSYLATAGVLFDRRVVPDEQPLIAAALRAMVAAGACLVCTTGGTGASWRGGGRGAGPVEIAVAASPRARRRPNQRTNKPTHAPPCPPLPPPSQAPRRGT